MSDNCKLNVDCCSCSSIICTAISLELGVLQARLGFWCRYRTDIFCGRLLHTLLLQVYLSGSYFSLPKEIISGLFKALSKDDEHSADSKEQVTFGNYILHASWLLKGSASQKSELLQIVCGGAALTVERVESVLLAFVTAILTSECARAIFPHMKDWLFEADSLHRLVSHLTNPLQGSSDQPPDMETWLTSCSLAQRIFEIGFAFCFFREAFSPAVPPDIRNYFAIDTSSTERLLVPQKIQHPLFPESFQSRLLDQSSLMLLTSCVPPELRGKLYPLFSSVHHGESFSTFCKKLVDKGPTMVVVRDNSGNVFGGYAATSWKFNPQFTGVFIC